MRSVRPAKLFLVACAALVALASSAGVAGATSRIKDLASELEGARKGGGHSGPALMIRPEGAAQIALIGPPNAGKSALHARLTGSTIRVKTVV